MQFIEDLQVEAWSSEQQCQVDHCDMGHKRGAYKVIRKKVTSFNWKMYLVYGKLILRT